MSDASREYPVRMIARVPREFPRLVSTAASRAYISPSAYLRQALHEKLARDGLSPTVDHAPEPRQAA